MKQCGASHGVGLCVAFMLTAAFAQEKLELELSLSTVTPNVRSDAPLSLDVRLESWSQELLAGRLELKCYDGRKLVGQYRSNELVLSAGERHSRVILPPVSLAKELSLLTVKVQFVSDSANHDLGTFELRVPVHWRRSFVIGVVHPDETAFAESGSSLGNALRLDQFDGGAYRGFGLTTTASLIIPRELRADSLGLFSFDVLALTGQGFSELAPDQLSAIGDWVEAGGSLLVVVDCATSPAQLEFLNRIKRVAQNNPLTFLDTDRLLPERNEDSPLTFGKYHPGLGRAILLSTLPQKDEKAELREIVAYLWKMRLGQSSQFRETGTLKLPPKQMSGGRSGAFGNPYSAYRPFKQVRLAEADGLATILLPDRVQGIPPEVVVVILTLFLITIVPVDYFLLGYLKRRKYTWLLLPLVSLGFTWFTIWLGNAYLGTADYRTSLEFVDLTDGNRVLRSSRFELLFTAKQREVTTELKQTLHTMISAQRKSDEDEWNAAGSMRTTDEEVRPPLEPDHPMYEGNMPTSFTVRQQMRKWSPQVSRQTSLRTERPVPQFELDDLEALLQKSSGAMATAEWQRRLREGILTLAPQSTVLLCNGHQVTDLTASEKDSRGERAGSPAAKNSQLRQLVHKACVRPASGLFSVVSQVSPNGAGDFEDLAVLDPDDLNQWLLVILEEQGDDYVVFRRLIRGGL